jgi:hypothetical protein
MLAESMGYGGSNVAAIGPKERRNYFIYTDENRFDFAFISPMLQMWKPSDTTPALTGPSSGRHC